MTIRELVDELRRLAAANDVEEFCDYVDEEFFYGAWDFLVKYMDENAPKEIPSHANPFYGHGRLFLKDIRGLLWALAK